MAESWSHHALRLYFKLYLATIGPGVAAYILVAGTDNMPLSVFVVDNIALLATSYVIFSEVERLALTHFNLPEGVEKKDMVEEYAE
jgi:hypothetical protein